MAEPQPIKCFCAPEPILAMYGQDTRTREYFIHVRAYKQRRLITELVVPLISGGVVRIRCRNCLRWHKISVKTSQVEVRPEALPDSIAV